MTARTAENISQQLELLANLTDVEIASSTVDSIRKTLASLGINTIERNGSTVVVKSARKKELLTALQTLVNKQRALNIAVIPSNSDLVPSLQEIDAQSIYERLASLTEVPHSKAEPELITLAHEVSLAISKAYPDTPEKARFNTRCNIKSQLVHDVLELMESSEIPGLKSLCDLWREKLKAFTQADSKLKRRANEERVEVKALAAETGENTPVKFQPMLDWATAILEKASEGKLRKMAWKDVAIALGLVTGRRMYGEILYELGTFTATSAIHVTAHELSKGKAEDNEVEELQEMTCLCDSSLVVAGKQWLIKQGKVQPATRPITGFTKVDDRARANAKYASDLNKYWREVAKSFGLPDSTTIHSLRKLYVTKAVELVDGYRSKGQEAKRLLGHQSWQTAQDNYNSDFRLV